MRFIISLLTLFLFISVAYCGPIQKFKAMKEIRDMQREKPSQTTVDAKKNLSIDSVKNMKLKKNLYKEANFSFCDFEGADIRGCVFSGCNFSFAVNLDKAIVDSNTRFTDSCNLSGADLPKAPATIDKSCNTTRFTDEEIKKFFEDNAM